MAPLLIERNGLIKFSFMMVTIMVGLFLGGYFVGYHTAEGLQLVKQQVVDLDIPAEPELDLVSVEPLVPEKIEPGEDIDVDLPDGVAESAVAEDDVVTVVTTATEVSKAQDRAEPSAEPSAQLTTEVPVSPHARDEVQTQQRSIGGPVEPVIDDPVTLMSDTADEASAKYSIQVGLFKDVENAERKVEDLMAQQLNAYRTQYTNSKNEQLHNVRFGYYADHSSAKLALKTFKTAMMSDGYLIRINR